MLDILIKNSVIVDGTGKSAFKADLGVVQGRIAMVAESVEQEAARTIEAQGLHLSPGFIDPHSHSDLALLVDPRAESKIRQGVTTEIIGNCGFSPAPLLGAALQETRAEAELFGIDVTWTSMAEYLERLRHPGIAVNIVPLVGHNTVRGSVLGYGDVQPEPVQQADPISRSYVDHRIPFGKRVVQAHFGLHRPNHLRRPGDALPYVFDALREIDLPG